LLQALAQGVVSQAGTVEKHAARVRRFFQRERKQHFFAILRRRHV